MNNDLTCRKTERKFDLFGHIKAKEIALADIRKDMKFGSRYTGMLTYSVKEQLRCFNNVSVCSIEELNDDIKLIPQPPTREKKSGEYVSVYDNDCLYKYYSQKKETSTYVFYLIEIKEAEGRISKELFSLIKDTGIKIHTTRNGVRFNPSVDFIENANFCSSIDDFLPLEDVPLSIRNKYDFYTLEQYRSILNIIDAKKNNTEYGRYDFRPKDSVAYVTDGVKTTKL